MIILKLRIQKIPADRLEAFVTYLELTENIILDLQHQTTGDTIYKGTVGGDNFAIDLVLQQILMIKRIAFTKSDCLITCIGQILDFSDFCL